MLKLVSSGSNTRIMALFSSFLPILARLGEALRAGKRGF